MALDNEWLEELAAAFSALSFPLGTLFCFLSNLLKYLAFIIAVLALEAPRLCESEELVLLSFKLLLSHCTGALFSAQLLLLLLLLLLVEGAVALLVFVGGFGGLSSGPRELRVFDVRVDSLDWDPEGETEVMLALLLHPEPVPPPEVTARGTGRFVLLLSGDEGKDPACCKNGWKMVMVSETTDQPNTLFKKLKTGNHVQKRTIIYCLSKIRFISKSI